MNIFKINFVLILAFLMSLSATFSADYYKVFEPSFTQEVPQNLYIEGNSCATSDCSTVTSQEISLLDGDSFQSCMELASSISYEDFLICLEDAEIQGNIANLGKSGWIVTKESAPTSFGSLTYFSPEGDSYLPEYFQTTSYPSVCYNSENEICIDSNIYGLSFGQLVDAIAEVGQVNIKNVDNPLKPIQVEIPVQIEETVCSAYRFANPNYWTPSSIPNGYSDFDALTQIDLLIQKTSDGITLLEEEVVIPIEAETCAGLAAFSWTPTSDLEDEEVTFTITTDVIDNQVINSIQDYAIVTETIYPSNLDNTCFTRAYDFTLANEPTFDLTTSLAQIQQGEYLYAGFNGGAWRDESITPMQFEALFIFDDGKTQEIVTTLQDTSGLDTSDYFVDLSETIFGLDAGNYEVTLITRPQGSNCVISEDVTQTQQLTILEVPTYTLDLYVSGNNSGALEGVSSTLNLLESRDEFQVEPSYSNTLSTDVSGYTQFEGLIAGTYGYTLTKQGYTSVSGELIIGSDTQYYVSMPKNNIAPLINLPQSDSIYYKETYELDLELFITDFNDGFEALTITPTITQGDASLNLGSNNILEVTTTNPNTITLNVEVEDPSGATASDSMNIIFLDNSAPQIIDFTAEPSDGEQPFTTTFFVEVQDVDSQDLTCTIDFDDGSVEEFNCNDITHTFNEIGQYNVELKVSDEYSEVTQVEKVFVFERTYASPSIDSFNYVSSNNLELPTNISISWETSHSDGLNLTCVLRVNGIDNAVDCDDTFLIENYNIPGTGVFTLLVYDTQGHEVSRRIERTFVTPIDNAPVIESFEVSTSGNISPVDATFTFLVSDDNDELSDMTCRIDFGDGTFSQDDCANLENPISHRYVNEEVFPITYGATLSVTDSVGNNVEVQSDLFTVESLVDESPVIESFEVFTDGNVTPVNATFTFSVSDDNDDLSELICEIRFDDSTSIEDICSNVLGVSHIYVNNGASTLDFTPRLIVEDLSGNRASLYSNSIFVEPTPTNAPVIEEFSASPLLGLESLETFFTIELSDLDGDLLEYNINYGNGNSASGVYTSRLILSQSYFSTGNYIVTLSVTDGEYVVEDSINLTVLGDNSPVIGSFEVSTNSNVTPVDATFTFSVSDDNDDLDNLRCTIYFGRSDGLVEDICSNIQNYTHTYTNSLFSTIEFIPQLRVIDSSGNLDLVTGDSIFVEPTPTNAPVIEEFSASPLSGVESLDTTFTIELSDLDGDNIQYYIDFGNGNSASGIYSDVLSLSQSYDSIGTYTATLSITDGHSTIEDSIALEVLENNAPVIEEFSASPLSGVESLDTIFTIELSDLDGDNIQYTIDFDNGNTQSGIYSDVLSLSQSYDSSGTYIATLSVTDGYTTIEDSITLEVLSDNAPVIESFDVVTSGTISPLNATFTYTISDDYDNLEDLSCRLYFGDSTSIQDNCENLDNPITHTYINNDELTQVLVATLIVEDLSGNRVSANSDSIEIDPSINNLPVIEEFSASPISGVDSLDTNFTIRLSDLDGDQLEYTLELDSGTYSGEYISEVTISESFNQVGVFTAILTVTDGRDIVQDLISVEVLDSNSEENMPSIDSFSMSTSNGQLLPNDLTFNWIVSHPRDLEMDCFLETPVSLNRFDCLDTTSFNISQFNVSGESDFTLYVSDSNGIMVNQSLTRTFYNPEEAPDLTLEMVSLDIASTIVPGEFSFTLRTKNETLGQRELYIEPQIKCSGVTYDLLSGTYLPTSAISKDIQGDEFIFPLKTDTVDFTGKIPTDKTCLFEVRVVDGYGTDISIVKNTMFSYPEQEELIPSINGFGTDVMDFLDGTIGQTFATGYNGVDFKLVNHEGEAKELSISLTSTQLGINFQEDVNLAPYTSKSVTVPLLFTKDQKGTFPVRLSVYDGEQKQTKYSYISIQ